MNSTNSPFHQQAIGWGCGACAIVSALLLALILCGVAAALLYISPSLQAQPAVSPTPQFTTSPSPPPFTIKTSPYSYNTSSHKTANIHITVENHTNHLYFIKEIYFQPWDASLLKQFDCQLTEPTPAPRQRAPQGYYYWLPKSLSLPPGNTTLTLACQTNTRLYTHVNIGVFLQDDRLLQLTITIRNASP